MKHFEQPHGETALAQTERERLFFSMLRDKGVSWREENGPSFPAANETGRLVLYYQVQVDELKQPAGAEVLLRWQHEALGLIHPSKFLPYLKEQEQLNEVGLWALRATCRKLDVWSAHPYLRNLTLAYNITPSQLTHKDFMPTLRLLMLECQFEPSRMHLEITEEHDEDSTELLLVLMQEIRAMGIRLSIDDYGVGHSSLYRLKKLPFDQLKIDRQFVSSLGDNEREMLFLRTTLDLAKKLGLEVVAEGIETQQQFDLLNREGVNLFQGYYLGMPKPGHEFEQAIAAKASISPDYASTTAPTWSDSLIPMFLEDHGNL